MSSFKMSFSNAIKLAKIPVIFRNSSSNLMKTAGILGDELLKGEVMDTNSPYITKELHSLGVKVKKICLVGDLIDEISEEVKTFSKSYDYVITTGGIGPTHDDVTFKGTDEALSKSKTSFSAVAQAFNVPLKLNAHLQTLVQGFYKTTDVNHPGMKLATVPENARLNFSDNSNYPNVAVENVYMFPGIPELFLRSFTALSKKLFTGGTVFYTKCVYVNLTEDVIAKELQDLEKSFSDVQVGSYPKLYNSSYKVKITIESINSSSTDAAAAKLINTLPKDAVVDEKNIEETNCKE